MLHRLGSLALMLACATTFTSVAAAQATVRLGGFVGYAFESGGDWPVFGAEARLRGERAQFDVQPRFHYQSLDGGSMWQLDGNILFTFTAPVPQNTPYMGFGIAINRLSLDSSSPGGPDIAETNVGANLVSGVVLDLNPTWRPYLQLVYTILSDVQNRANLAIGILLRVGG
ncbi:MAG: outer membrane protein [Gemmatimonadaceae bacterium]